MTHFRAQLVFLGVAGTPWYMTLKGAAGVDTPLLFATAVHNLIDEMLAWTVNDVRIEHDGVVDVLDDTTEELLSSYAGDSYSLYGTNTENALPYANQMLVRLNTDGIVTGPTGRTTRVRGKINVPGFSDTYIQDAVFNTGGRQQVAAAFNDFDAAVGMVVYSPTGQQTFDVTGILVNAEPAVLRSRRD